MMRSAALAGAVLLVGMCFAVEAEEARVKIYNTAKQKLIDGKQVVGGTVLSPDPNMYCAMANAGFDYLWIEMQHSPLGYQDVARMIFACRGSAAMPFIRVPDATEGDIQKATDIGALGIIVPTVDTVEKAEAAVKWSKFPPFGRRSQGAGQYREIWGERLPADRQRQHDGGDHDRDPRGRRQRREDRRGAGDRRDLRRQRRPA